jgi:hypothetical protein
VQNIPLLIRLLRIFHLVTPGVAWLMYEGRPDRTQALAYDDAVAD